MYKSDWGTMRVFGDTGYLGKKLNEKQDIWVELMGYGIFISDKMKHPEEKLLIFAIGISEIWEI